jgi:opine dehydrogenase
MRKYKICICGGGNISHVLAGLLSNKGHTINVLTRKPKKWSKKISVLFKNNNYEGNLNTISNNSKNVIPSCDIIIVSCPVTAINDIITNINPFLTKNMTLINIPGRFFINYTKHLENNIITFARTPYICRIKEYGNSVEVYGTVYKNINYWTNNPLLSKTILKNLFDFDINLLKNHFSIDLINSNLLLHSTRLFVLFNKKTFYDHIPLFYGDWNNESSELLIKCDNELQKLINKMNETQTNNIYIKPIIEHYEVNDSVSLTNKIKNITAFKSILSPMKLINNHYIPDFNNRYFLEEQIGLKIIIDLSNEYNINIPYITSVYNFIITVKTQYFY